MDPICAEDLPFENRAAAGVKLGRHLYGRHWPTNTRVLGLPRHGLLVAKSLAETLRLPFEVFGMDSSPLAGGTVILVDDGLATCAGMREAIDAVRRCGAARVIVAVPVGARQAVRDLAPHVNETVCPYCPEPFQSVGMYYADFPRSRKTDLRHAA